MEGYTNVVGSPYDFDDLDIEGRVVDEWNASQEEEKKIPKVPVTTSQFDEKSVLSEQVKLDNGKQANVFSVAKKKDNRTLFICHICSDTLVGVSSLRQHVQTDKHRSNMTIPAHPRAKFLKLDPKENLSLEPGEPVPPGLEEVIIKNCLIQPTVDAYKPPLIGLEFLAELTQCNNYEEPYYYCLMCEKTGGQRNMLIHLTSIYHNLKYLSLYFPTVARKLHALPNRKMKKAFGLVVTDVIGDIEAKMGRMKPFMELRSDFDAPGRMAELQKVVNAGPHLRESDGQYFDEKAVPEYMNIKCQEVLNAPPVTGKTEDTEKAIENKDPTPGSLFNKAKNISCGKKQLRTREEGENRNSSPDVQIVDIQLPKVPPGQTKRTRSRSLSSLSTLSSKSSRSRGPRYSRSSRSYRQSRSRSRTPYRYRRRSPYSYRHSPGRRSRDRSPYRKRRYHSPERSKERLDRYGRSREIYDCRSDKYRRERSLERHSPVPTAEEKIRWDKFREELKKVETVKLEKLRYYEKNPEKHPQYPDEWKSFWNRRYNELQRSGIDPSKHDFKPEWISFWTKRMKELYDEDLNTCKEDLRKKFELPEDPGREYYYQRHRPRKRSPALVDISPPTPDKKDVIADIKTTWKAFTGSDIKDTPKRPLSPWEDERSPPYKREHRSPSPGSINEKLLEEMPQRRSKTASLIFVLRKLTVLEQQLGYLAPKVFELMQQALALEKIKEDASLDLLYEPDNAFYLETVREKLIGLLCAGVVPRNMVNTARSAIKHIDIALYLMSKKERSLPVSSMNPGTIKQHLELPKSDPVVVPGVGQVDKVAIAQQIATALIAQGKTDVTESELEQLINAVVGMAEASANSAQPMTTANFLQQLQNAHKSSGPGSATTASVTPVPNPNTLSTVKPVFQPTTQAPTQILNTQAVANNNLPSSEFGGLKLLQSAYNETVKIEHDSPNPEIVGTDSSEMALTSEKELANTLTTFNNLSKDEQPSFVQKLKTTNPALYKQLYPFIPASTLSDQSKRSPISISLSKAKSEQKIKPISSDRLSPFSSRSGGANPTVGEGIINVDDELNVNPSTISSSKLNRNDLDENDEDDDDDDYSYEDVYKAAQEKLRQNQIEEDKKNHSATQNSIVDPTKEAKQKEHVQKENAEIHDLGTNEQKWNIDNREINLLNANKNNQQVRGTNQHREIPARVTQHDQIQSTNVPSQNYYGPSPNRLQPSRPATIPEAYSDGSVYSIPNTEASVNFGQHRNDTFYNSGPGSYLNEQAPSQGTYNYQPTQEYGNNQHIQGYGNNPTNYDNDNQHFSGFGNKLNPDNGNNMVHYGNEMSHMNRFRQMPPQRAYSSNNYPQWTSNQYVNPPQRNPHINYPRY